MAIATKRESSFELIRLLAQFMIVLYHIYLFFIYPTYEEPFSKALWLPLHIGVPLFVFISGYFGIKVSGRGLFNLLGRMLVYTVPLSLVYVAVNPEWGGVKNLVKSLLFVSNTPHWFMRTYLCLYLFAPVINEYIANVTVKKRIYLLLSLSFISIYMGTLSVIDPALHDGKNLANFILLYLIGNTLRAYADKWKSIKMKKLVAAYILLNLALFIGYGLLQETIIGKAIFRLSYPYNSPVLLINAILFFMIIGKLTFKSDVVNYLASSSLAIYLLPGATIILFGMIGPMMLEIKSMISNQCLFFFCAIGVTILIMFVSILVDKLLNPIWSLCKEMGNRAERKTFSK